MSVTRIPLPDWAKKTDPDERLDMPLAETELSVRTVNCLEEHGLLTVRDLLHCTPDRLMEIPNFGPKTLQTVFDALEKVGFSRQTAQPSQDEFGLLDEERTASEEAQPVQLGPNPYD